MIGELINIARDAKRILTGPKDASVSRAEIFVTYFRLLIAKLRNRTEGTAQLLNYRVKYFDALNLLHLYREIFVAGIYRFELTNSEPVIVDCGSNIGLSILYFKKMYPQAKIVGFEPHPAIHAVLHSNVTANRLQNVSLHECALDSKQGSITFFESTDDPGALNMGLHARSAQQNEIQVTCDLLSNYIEGPVDLLKMDIEGAEITVLTELAERGKLQLVDQMVLEYHHHQDPTVDQLSVMLNLLESQGFGYQLNAYTDRLGARDKYQDVLIYAYRKIKKPTVEVSDE